MLQSRGVVLCALRSGMRLRCQSSLRDMAAKAILKSSLDSYAAGVGSGADAVTNSTDSSTAPPLRADIEYDALTWKSIVVSLIFFLQNNVTF